jgi:hypothetical protein
MPDSLTQTLLAKLGIHLPSTEPVSPEQQAAQDAAAREAQSHLEPWRQGTIGALENAGRFVTGLMADPTGAMPETAAGKAGMLAAAAPLGTFGNPLKGFYSRAERVVQGFPETINASRALSKLKAGASGEELAYRGLTQALEPVMGQPVAKATLEQTLRERPLAVGKTTLGGSALQHNVFDDQGRHLGTVGTDREADALIEQAGGSGSVHVGQPAAVFKKYQVPGGSNYQESLYQLDPKPRLDVLEAKLKAQGKLEGPEVEEYQRLTDVEAFPRTAQGAFHSTHWDGYPNVLVHARHAEHTLGEGPEAAKGRLLEELQSDWHEQGRSYGYRTPELKQAFEQAKQDVLAAERAQLDYLNSPDSKAPYQQAQYERLKLNHQLARQKLEDLRTDLSARVPNAPFKDKWADLALKDQLMDVARNPELQWLGLTTPKTHLERWGSSGIGWMPDVDNPGHVIVGYNPGMDAQEVQRLERYPEWVFGEPDNTLHGPGEVGSMPLDSPTTPSQLRDVIYTGNMNHDKVWKKILAEPDGGMTFPEWEARKHEYGEEFPNKLRKLLEPFGGTVEKAYLPTPQDELRRATAAEPNPTRPNPATEIWLARLSPDIKRAILEKGLPLLTALWMMRQQQTQPPGAPNAQ